MTITGYKRLEIEGVKSSQGESKKSKVNYHPIIKLIQSSLFDCPNYIKATSITADVKFHASYDPCSGKLIPFTPFNPVTVQYRFEKNKGISRIGDLGATSVTSLAEDIQKIIVITELFVAKMIKIELNNADMNLNVLRDVI